jgi:hypothetical protein
MTASAWVYATSAAVSKHQQQQHSIIIGIRSFCTNSKTSAAVTQHQHGHTQLPQQ